MKETAGLRSGTRRWQIGVINGPNMGNLKRRSASVYGRSRTIEELATHVAGIAESLGVEIKSVCSNHEGVIVDWIQEHGDDLDGILINPAGLAKYGASTLQALTDTGLPVMEVHFANTEKLGTNSIFTAGVMGACIGLRRHSYTAALAGLVCALDDDDFARPLRYEERGRGAAETRKGATT